MRCASALAPIGLVLVLAACRPSAPPPPPGPAPAGQGSTSPAASEPPTVLMGNAELVCEISSSANGHQKLVLRDGSGLEFDAVVSPIVDGTVKTKGPEAGGGYRFTSHLAQPATGKLAGVGDVAIEELETKVVVEMTRYQQPDGPGTALSFSSTDMERRGIYLEFVGKAKAPNGEHYGFRINLGSAAGGSGKVTPANANAEAPIYAKMVMVEAPATTVIVKTELSHLAP